MFTVIPLSDLSNLQHHHNVINSTRHTTQVVNRYGTTMVQIIFSETRSINVLKAAFKFKTLQNIRDAPLFADIMIMQKKLYQIHRPKPSITVPLALQALFSTQYHTWTLQEWHGHDTQILETSLYILQAIQGHHKLPQ